jgi:hypothetical protein
VIVPADAFLDGFIGLTEVEKRKIVSRWKRFSDKARAGDTLEMYLYRKMQFLELQPLQQRRAEDKIMYSCSCPLGQKKGACRHALAASIQFSGVQIPARYRINLLPTLTHKKQGRPAQVEHQQHQKKRNMRK